MDKLLHIYGQGAWHEDVFIVGNRDSLIALRNQIDATLNNNSIRQDYWVGDGEGYGVTIKLLEGDWNTEEWRRLAVPYYEDYAMEKSDTALSPWEIK